MRERQFRILKDSARITPATNINRTIEDYFAFVEGKEGKNNNRKLYSISITKRKREREREKKTITIIGEERIFAEKLKLEQIE